MVKANTYLIDFKYSKKSNVFQWSDPFKLMFQAQIKATKVIKLDPAK